MIPNTYRAYITPAIAIVLIGVLLAFDSDTVTTCGTPSSVAVIILAVALGVWLGGLLGKVFT